MLTVITLVALLAAVRGSVANRRFRRAFATLCLAVRSTSDRDLAVFTDEVVKLHRHYSGQAVVVTCAYVAVLGSLASHILGVP